MGRSGAPPFWKRKSLRQMNRAEWESLCDGCGQCCVHKLEDEKTGDIVATNVACRLLDLHSCRCAAYTDRMNMVPDCVRLTPAKTRSLSWLPRTCAYRLLAAGEDLPDWHPLVSRDPESVHKAGISVRGRVVSEKAVEALEDHVTEWLWENKGILKSEKE